MISLVSIIIPTYSRCDTLERAVESCLNQTYRDIEVIIVDDNNSNSLARRDTVEFMKKYNNNKRVIYIKHEKNKNGAAARNSGIKFAKGKYIAFLDDDDEFYSDKIKKQVERIISSPTEYKAVYCNYEKFMSKKKVHQSSFIGVANEGDLTYELLANTINACLGSSLLIEKEAVDLINGFDESFIRHQDLEFIIRYFQHYKISLVENTLVKIHAHPHSNLPNGSKFEEIKMKYLDKFKNIIDSFSREKVKKIYMNNYFQIASIYMKSCDFAKGLEYLKRAEQYGKVGFKKKGFIFLRYIINKLKIRQIIKVIFKF